MTQYNAENPFIVQGDHTVLVEVDSPHYGAGRDELVRFAELVKSPEHIHTYRITPLSIWNACATGMTPDEITAVLAQFAKYEVPHHVNHEVFDYASRYGRLKLHKEEDQLILVADDVVLAQEMLHNKHSSPFLSDPISEVAFRIEAKHRGKLKQILIKIGFPAEDLAGYVVGDPLPFSMREKTLGDAAFKIREYQKDAVDCFYANGSTRGGSGVIVLPCGAGKTIVGISAINALQTSTLVLTTGVTSCRQWQREILDKTTLTEEQVGRYTSEHKEVLPVTIATYNIMTWRKNKDADFKHLKVFDERNWGLIIYDEVHLLPAPVFQVTSTIQARRRLGLTATLVREDHLEEDVFALIGPKKADVPWKVLEKQGWIATATCSEFRLPMPEEDKLPYAVAEKRQKFRLASENRYKAKIAKKIIDKHAEDSVLVIGMYVDQVNAIAKTLGIPAMTGATGQATREKLFAKFRSGELKQLAVSKVANFAVDLPDASVAIQISGTYGSRQEEAQRLGRILRPKPDENQAHFYTLVTADTVEQEFALKRQLFLCEQGYSYDICDIDDVEAFTL